MTSDNNTDGTTALTVEANAGAHDKHLKEIPGVNANTKIVVFYKAKLNTNAVIAGANGELGGNPNTVTLTYSNNPMSGGTGTSAPDAVKDYTYGLKINKVDLGTEEALDGAKFTIQATGADDGASKNLYVQENGSLGIDRHEFETSQTDKVIPGLTDRKSGDNKLTKKDNSEKNADGTLNITVGDTKQINLPLTGLNGVTFTWIAGGAVLCIGVAHLIRSRKRDEGSEE